MTYPVPAIIYYVAIGSKGVGIHDLRFWESWKRIVWHSSWATRS